MKKIAVFTILIFASFFGNAQTGLKWFNLGYKSSKGNQMTTIGGVKGCLYAYKTKNNTVAQIEFRSVNHCNSKEPVFVRPYDVSIVKEGLEAKFELILTSSVKNSNNNVWSADFMEDMTIQLVDLTGGILNEGIIITLTDKSLYAERRFDDMNNERKEKLTDF